MPDADSPALPEPRGKGRARIDFATRLAVLQLGQTAPHLSASDVARLTGVSHQTVLRLRQIQTSDVKQLTQAVLQTEIAPAIEDWVTARTLAADRGDHRPARDMLLAAGAIEDTTKAQALNVGFQVLIAPSPGTPAYAVNAQPSTVVSETSAASAHLASALVGQTDSAPDAPAHTVPPTTAPDVDYPPPTVRSAQCADAVRTTQKRSRVRR